MIEATDKFTRDRLGRESHVWLAQPPKIHDPELLARYRAILDKEEIARLERLRSPVLQQLFLVSHALVRTTLSYYRDVDPKDWRFEEGEEGKPMIASPRGDGRLCFNLSHTAGLSACVIALDHDCGVDIERVGRVKDLLAVAKRVFSGVERADLEARSGADQQGRFSDYWTLKEAYIKATGLGFKTPLRKISFRLDGSEAISVGFDPGYDDDPARWLFGLENLDDAYRLGVAIEVGSAPRPLILRREVVPVA